MCVPAPSTVLTQRFRIPPLQSLRPGRRSACWALWDRVVAVGTQLSKLFAWRGRYRYERLHREIASNGPQAFIPTSQSERYRQVLRMRMEAMKSLKCADQILFPGQAGVFPAPPGTRERVRYLGSAPRPFRYGRGDRRQARQELEIPEDAVVVSVFPGSWLEVDTPVLDAVLEAFEALGVDTKRRSNDVIGQHAGAGRHGQTTAPAELYVLLCARREEGGSECKNIEAFEVQVPAVHDIE